MDAFSDVRVREMACVLASQVAKTECVNNMIGQRIETNPGPMILLQPTLKMAEAWSKDRLAPMLRDTPCLRGKVADAKARNTGNTVLHKQFPGGHLTITGANSPSSLSMRPVRDVFCDEEDRYPASAGSEGDPVKLAITRTRAFWNAKHVHISSPGTKDLSRIEPIWERSDQRYFYVPCYSCKTSQTLRWAQVQWDKDPDTGDDLPESARYVCERCGAWWSNLQRRAAVRRGEWRATKPFRGCAGFRLNALYAPWESCDLDKLVLQWVEAQSNPELLKVFVNTVLADWWELKHYSRTVDETGLIHRRERFPERGTRPVIPAAVGVLVAGVDLQDNRFEISVYGFGRGEESWLLKHYVLYGDPFTKTGDVLSAAWNALDAWLLEPWYREHGGADFIRAIALDTGGHHTQAAYAFAGARYRRTTPDGGSTFMFATKGVTGTGELWPMKPSKGTTSAAPLWPIRVDAGKGQVYARLGIAEPGPGYIHLTDAVDVEFLKTLTAERCETTVDKKGYPKLTWKMKKGRVRNEGLDCAVLATAALVGLRVNGFDLDRELDRAALRLAWEPPDPTRARGEGSAARAGETRAAGEDAGARGDEWLRDTDNWLDR